MNDVQIVKHLNEILNSIKTEMEPLLKGKGGYFTIPILFFSYVLEMSEKINGKRSNGPRDEVAFLNQYFSKVDSVYTPKINDLFFKMYRHGLAHRFTPSHFLFKNKDVLSWFVYKGSRTNQRIQPLMVSHLNPVFICGQKEDHSFPEYNIYNLPICINALFEDLVSALNLYIKDLQKESELRRKFNLWKEEAFFKLERIDNEMSNYIETDKPSTL